METSVVYKPRIADGMLQEQLEASGVVLIQGPKWCGKTTTAEQQAKSVLYMDAPKTRKANLLLSESDPEILFQGETPRLIDEWQLARLEERLIEGRLARPRLAQVAGHGRQQRAGTHDVAAVRLPLHPLPQPEQGWASAVVTRRLLD